MSHCHQSECILLRGERDRMCCLLSSFVILFIIEQGPLQILGPLVELYYCLALEKIYRMLIPRIRAFSLADLWGQTILSQRAGHGHPRTPHPSYAPVCRNSVRKLWQTLWGICITCGKREWVESLQEGNVTETQPRPQGFSLKKMKGKALGTGLIERIVV